MQEFEQLCKTGGVYQIAPEAIGKKFDLKYTSTDQISMLGTMRPVEEISIAYVDAATGETVATAKAYLARPGWLVRNHWIPSPSGGSAPLFGRPQCFPNMEEGNCLKVIANKFI